jgi:hypothetical protein
VLKKLVLLIKEENQTTATVEGGKLDFFQKNALRNVSLQSISGPIRVALGFLGI